MLSSCTAHRYPNRTSGFELRRFREFAELSRSELSSAVGMAERDIADMESNKRPIGIDDARNLAVALHCHLGRFIFPGWCE